MDITNNKDEAVMPPHQPSAQQQQQQQQQPTRPRVVVVNVVPPPPPPPVPLPLPPRARTGAATAVSSSPSSATLIPAGAAGGGAAHLLSNQVESTVKRANLSYFANTSNVVAIPPEDASLICKEEMPRFQDPFARFAMGIPPWPALSSTTTTTTTTTEEMPTTASSSSLLSRNKATTTSTSAPAMATHTAAAAAATEAATAATDKKVRKKYRKGLQAIDKSTLAAATTTTVAAAAGGAKAAVAVDTAQKRQAALAGHRRRRGSLLTSWSEHLTYDWSELFVTPAAAGNTMTKNTNDNSSSSVVTGSAAWNTLLRHQVLRRNPHAFPQVPQMTAVQCLATLQPRLLTCTIIPPEHSPIYDAVAGLQQHGGPAAKNKRFKPSPSLTTAAAAPADEDGDCKPPAAAAAAQNDMEVAVDAVAQQDEDQEKEIQEMAKLYKTMISQETDTYMDMKRREYQYMNASSVKDRMVHLASETANLAARETRLRRQAASVFAQDHDDDDDDDDAPPSKGSSSSSSGRKKKASRMQHFQQQANKMAGHWAETDRQPLDRPYWSDNIWNVLSVDPMQVRCLSEADVY